MNVSIKKLGIAASIFGASWFASASFAAGTPYDTDEQNFFVSGQTLNDSLAGANSIICYMANMMPDSYVNQGPYKATIYEERCDTSAADSSSEASKATKTSSQSSSTASSSSTTTATGETATDAILEVVKKDAGSPVKGRAWVSAAAQDEFSADALIYVRFTQSSGPTTDAPMGNFVMRWSEHIDGSQDVFGTFDGFGREDGALVGQGYLKANGNAIAFRDNGEGRGPQGGYGENNIYVEYISQADGSKDKEGVYRELSFLELWDYNTQGMPSQEDFENGDVFVELQNEYRFYLSVAEKGYCRYLARSQALSWPSPDTIDAKIAEADAIIAAGGEVDWDEIFQPTKTTVYRIADYKSSAPSAVPLAANYDGKIDIDEECFTTDLDYAQRNVHRYGVYHTATSAQADSTVSAGDRLEVQNAGFPLRAEITQTAPDGSSNTIPVFGFADHWGVHIDPRGRDLITEATSASDLSGTPFYEETFGSDEDDTGAKQAYYIGSSDVKIEKRSVQYSALDELDGISIAMYIDDFWWATEFAALGFNSSAYQEVEGSWDKDTGKFTFDKGLSFLAGYEEVTLASPVEFTPAEWQATMKKAYGREGDDWYFEDLRDMGVWSHDLRLWFDISVEAMNDPDSSTCDGSTVAKTKDPVGCPAAGLRTEESEFISIAQLATDLDASSSDGKLYCMRDCLDGVKTETAFTEAVAETTPSSVSSPFADVGEYLKTDITVNSVNYGFNSFSEAAHEFDTLAAGDTVKLGGSFVAIQDFVGADQNLPHFMEGEFTGLDGCDSGDVGCTANFQMSGDYYQYGFSKGNLDKLISPGAYLEDAGIVPVVHTDIATIPGTASEPKSGFINVSVRVVEGEDHLIHRRGTEELCSAEGVGSYTDCELAIQSTAKLYWESNGSTFTIKIPTTITEDNPDGQIAFYFSTSSGLALAGTYGNTNEDTFAWSGGPLETGLATDGAGISWSFFRIFSHHHSLDKLYSDDDGGAGGHQLYTLSGPTTSGGHNLQNLSATPAGGTHTVNDVLSNPISDCQMSHNFCNMYGAGLQSFFNAGTYSMIVEMEKVSGDDLILEGPAATEDAKFDRMDFQFRVVNDDDLLFAESYSAGQFFEGLQKDDMFTYTAVSGEVIDENGNAIKKGSTASAALKKMVDPEGTLGNVYFTNADGWQQPLTWGLRTGQLVTSDVLPDLECRKEGKDTYQDHPVYGNSTDVTRYCSYRLWEGNATSYAIQLETRPTYVLYADGAPVDFDEPKVVYYEVPETTAFGKDGGKRIRLEYSGNGDLCCIPGFVYNTETGENLGDHYSGVWSESLRYINRFNIPDGALLEDALDSSITYQVKGLEGEEWLAKAGGTGTPTGVSDLRGTFPYTGNAEDLVKGKKMRVLGDPDHIDEYIGARPAATVNCGDTAAVHGTLTLNASYVGTNGKFDSSKCPAE